jgi:hypothetical protein
VEFVNEFLFAFASGCRTCGVSDRIADVAIAVIAASSIVGGVIIGNGSGAPFYQMFDVLIAVGTVAGLGVINTRLIIWGRAGPERMARWWYSALVVGSSTALIAAQWRMAFP